MQEKLAKAQERLPPLSKLLGVKLLSLDKERVTAEMVAREDMGNGSGILHGGAYMAFADYLGAMGTVLNLQKGQATTTMESKTNFFAPAPIGSTVLGESTPLHRGRRTQVWQTRLTNADGRLLAMITQTQMVLEAKPKVE
ncbi:MAG: PaaI family thioesterase [Hyphomicrobiaceae bacterium]